VVSHAFDETKKDQHLLSSAQLANLQGNVNAFANKDHHLIALCPITMCHLFCSTLRNHLRHHLTALREENARVLRATLVGNRIVVACNQIKVSDILQKRNNQKRSRQ
jgi:hypothetical protein